MNIDCDPTSLAVQARDVLHQILAQNRSWVGIHAAEALAAMGESTVIRDRLRETAMRDDNLLPRIGVWRMLASTASTPQERALWTGRIEQVVMEASAPDRKQAVESLAKLGHPLSGAVRATVQQMAMESTEANAILPIWCLHNSGEPGMLARLERALTSIEPLARQRAGYALRWIGTRDPALLGALVRAAEAEPTGTLPRTFLVSAAFVLNAEPSRRMAWRRELEVILRAGPVAASFEAGQALLTDGQPRDLSLFASLLDHSEADTRVAAANGILHLNR